MGFLNFLSNKPVDNSGIEERGYSNYNNVLSAFISEDVCSEDDVVKIPVVQSILEITCGTIAQLPVYLYKDNGDGSVEKVDDYRDKLLNDEPNQFQTAYNMKKTIVRDYLLYGSHRIYKDMSRNEIIGLYSLPSRDTIVKTFVKKSFIVTDYEVQVNTSGGTETFKPHELINILRETKDGVISKGALHHGVNIFNIVKEEGYYIESIYKNGAMPLGTLTAQGKLNDNTIERLRGSWQNIYSGTRNAAKTVILEEGLEYKPITLNPKDLLLNESKKENLSEICRLFNIPESLVNSNANKYGSLEQNNIAFLQYTLSPIISSIENALNQSLLLEEEKEQGYFFAFDTSEVLRTTEKEKYEAIQVGLNSGVITMNEARYKLNLKGIPDDVMKWSLGNVLYVPKTGKMIIPNMGIGVPGYENMQNQKGKISENIAKDKEENQVNDSVDVEEKVDINANDKERDK